MSLFIDPTSEGNGLDRHKPLPSKGGNNFYLANQVFHIQMFLFVFFDDDDVSFLNIFKSLSSIISFNSLLSSFSKHSMASLKTS